MLSEQQPAFTMYRKLSMRKSEMFEIWGLNYCKLEDYSPVVWNVVSSGRYYWLLKERIEG
jgi:hypothetical protein